MITREEAHNYMWLKNDECPSMRWGNHATIRDYVDLMIDDIYDSFGSQLSSNPLQLTCDGCAFEDGIYIPTHCILCSRDKKDHYDKKDTK